MAWAAGGVASSCPKLAEPVATGAGVGTATTGGVVRVCCPVAGTLGVDSWGLPIPKIK